jgi:hypothetical protein
LTDARFVVCALLALAQTLQVTLHRSKLPRCATPRSLRQREAWRFQVPLPALLVAQSVLILEVHATAFFLLYEAVVLFP